MLDVGILLREHALQGSRDEAPGVQRRRHDRD
jgi:hypothetical protein